jgi:hypothetical protein
VSIGDPYRDSHALAVVHVLSGVVLLEATVAEGKDGYAHALELVDQHASGRRAFAVEGTGSFGAGLTRFLGAGGERVVEVGRLRRERRSGGKTDKLDAIRAARTLLGEKRPAIPRAGGTRESIRALLAAREGAVSARTAAYCQLRDLLVTTPEPFRSELRPLSPARLLARLTVARPDRRQDPELRGSLLALKAVARRIQQLTAEERQLAREVEQLVQTLAPQLLDQPGIGPLRAARSLLVTLRPSPQRGRLRPSRRRRPDPGLIRSDDPLPARPLRRPQAQQNPAPDHRHPPTRAPADDRLHQPTRPRRENPPRSNALPQALPRPPPLPPTRAPTTDNLTEIEASLAQASGLRVCAKVAPVGRAAAGALYVVGMAAAVVGVDVLFFRGHFWERLADNVGIVLVFVAFYFRFLYHASAKRGEVPLPHQGC